jgi:glycosyltransferase involved in cell wall biosynthesis
MHVPFTFAPDPIGGTEIYVEALARGLTSYGIESVVCAPSSNDENKNYEHRGFRVRRYRTASTSSKMLQELYGNGDPIAAVEFAEILEEERPDIVHLHAFTRGVSLLSMRAAKQRHIPVFFTYHTPTVSCQRGTLMLYGSEVCDGVLKVQRCAACSLEGQGVPQSAATLMSAVPMFFGQFLETMKMQGGIWTALQMSCLTQLRHDSFKALMNEVDAVVALADWVVAILIRNGVPREKIVLSKHGLPQAKVANTSQIEVNREPLRVVFLGRINRDKGADTLIKAVRAAPELRIELHLYGLVQSAVDQNLLAELRREAANDNRIAFLPPVSNDQVISLLKDYHVLAVPSRCFETGPLVVLEALAAGTPILGSRLGGITEWIRHEENGLLVSIDDHRAWADAFRRCARDRDLLSKLRQNAKSPQAMSGVAQQMAQLYRKHVHAPLSWAGSCEYAAAGRWL